MHHVFDGSTNLSIIISIVSTVTPFFMIQLYLYALGQYVYLNEHKIHLPFFNLAKSFLIIVGSF